MCFSYHDGTDVLVEMRQDPPPAAYGSPYMFVYRPVSISV